MIYLNQFQETRWVELPNTSKRRLAGTQLECKVVKHCYVNMYIYSTGAELLPWRHCRGSRRIQKVLVSSEADS